MRATMFATAACAVLLTALTVPSNALAEAPAKVSYYVSLGDSLAASFQPDGDLDHGYAEQLYAYEKHRVPGLRLHKLGCSGETTVTLIYGGICSYTQGSELAQAVAFLTHHAGQIAFVTIDIGANDILEPCYFAGELNRQCTKQTLPTVRADLRQIDTALQAAGAGTPIIGMTYYDAFLGLWHNGPAGRRLARYDERVMEIFNRALTTTFGSAMIPVADVEKAFASRDFNDRVSPGTGQPGIPVNVIHACAWTWFCSLKDIHATTAGYGVLAQAFETVLPRGP